MDDATGHIFRETRGQSTGLLQSSWWVLSVALALAGIGVVAVAFSFAPFGVGASVIAGSAMFGSAVAIAIKWSCGGLALPIAIMIAVVVSFLFPYSTWYYLALPTLRIFHAEPIHGGEMWGASFSRDLVIPDEQEWVGGVPGRVDMHRHQGIAYFLTNPTNGVYYGVAVCPGLGKGLGTWVFESGNPVSSGSASFKSVFGDWYSFCLVHH